MACQNCHPENQRAFDLLTQNGLVECLDSRTQHLGSAQCMNIEYADSQAGSFDAGLGDGRRDVVKLQIEEYSFSHGNYLPYDLGAGGCEKPLADLEHSGAAAQAFYQTESLTGVFDVEGDNNWIVEFRVCH